MIIDRKYRPDLVVCKDAHRGAITNPWLEKDQNLVIATTGHVLVAVPVQVETSDVGGAIDKDAFRHGAIIAKMVKSDDYKISLNATDAANSARSYPRPAGETFPDWRQVHTPSNDTVTISFNAKLLAQVVAAMGVENNILLTVDLKDPMYCPLKVESSDAGNAAFALVMPVRHEKAGRSLLTKSEAVSG